MCRWGLETPPHFKGHFDRNRTRLNESLDLWPTLLSVSNIWQRQHKPVLKLWICRLLSKTKFFFIANIFWNIPVVSQSYNSTLKKQKQTNIIECIGIYREVVVFWCHFLQYKQCRIYCFQGPGQDGIQCPQHRLWKTYEGGGLKELWVKWGDLAQGRALVRGVHGGPGGWPPGGAGGAGHVNLNLNFRQNFP